MPQLIKVALLDANSLSYKLVKIYGAVLELNAPHEYAPATNLHGQGRERGLIGKKMRGPENVQSIYQSRLRSI
jgi:hypothetical protein